MPYTCLLCEDYYIGYVQPLVAAKDIPTPSQVQLSLTGKCQVDYTLLLSCDQGSTWNILYQNTYTGASQQIVLSIDQYTTKTCWIRLQIDRCRGGRFTCRLDWQATYPGQDLWDSNKPIAIILEDEAAERLSKLNQWMIGENPPKLGDSLSNRPGNVVKRESARAKMEGSLDGKTWFETDYEAEKVLPWFRVAGKIRKKPDLTPRLENQGRMFED